MRELVLMIIAATAIWVAVDAGKRDWSHESFATKPFVWAIGCLLLWIVVFPVYLFKRRQAPLASEAATAVPAPLSLPHPVPSAPAAGWYADPNDPSQLRFWNGDGWTERTATRTS